jgi:hypothetical protein
MTRPIAVADMSLLPNLNQSLLAHVAILPRYFHVFKVMQPAADRPV